MQTALSLIGIPLLFACIVLFVRTKRAYATTVRCGAMATIIATVCFVLQHYSKVSTFDLSTYHWLKFVFLAIEGAVTIYIVYVGIKHRSYLVAGFSVLQFGISAGLELTLGRVTHTTQSIHIDKLSILMICIAGIIGGFICVYAIEYMKDYHHHHPEVQDRRYAFFAILFLFLSAMFALVICNDLTMLLFFWEITSLCSFLLIGYSKSEEAMKNALCALTINVFGGLCFTVGMGLLLYFYHLVDMNSLLMLSTTNPWVLVAVFLIACAGLTKSAQLPFSKWLLGAMVAPTPTSALLHSSTMVKAGVYLILRLAPMLGQNAAGIAITLIGGITFFVAAILAVPQTDAKKILAYSTISNLGLIVACASIDTAESLWAAIMLIVFHAIAKSLLFLSVGSTEHQLGSRNVEDMDGLVRISATLTLLLIIGIAGMFVAPFGMLISKWAAMKAFVDSRNILIVLLISFGSTVTLFFWTKWMGKLIANAHRFAPTDYVMRNDERVSLTALAIMVITVCAMHPLVSRALVIPYINSNMHIHFTSPIAPLATTIIIFMMCMLFIIPLILIPLYKKNRVKETSVYLSGQNAGDNESFYGSMGDVRQLELRNWYMKEVINEVGLTKWSNILCAATIITAFVILLGGAALI